MHYAVLFSPYKISEISTDQLVRNFQLNNHKFEIIFDLMLATYNGKRRKNIITTAMAMKNISIVGRYVLTRFQVVSWIQPFFKGRAIAFHSSNKQSGISYVTNDSVWFHCFNQKRSRTKNYINELLLLMKNKVTLDYQWCIK